MEYTYEQLRKKNKSRAIIVNGKVYPRGTYGVEHVDTPYRFVLVPNNRKRYTRQWSVGRNA